MSFKKRGGGSFDIHIEEEKDVITEVEIRIMWPQVKKCQQLPEDGRGKEHVVPWSLWRKHSPVDPLILAQSN